MKRAALLATTIVLVAASIAQARFRVIKLEDCGNGHFAWAVVSDEDRPDGRFTICDVVNCDGTIWNYELGFGFQCGMAAIPPGTPADSVPGRLPLTSASIYQIGQLPTGIDSIDVSGETPTSTGYTEYARLLHQGSEVCRLNRVSGDSPTSSCGDDLE